MIISCHIMIVMFGHGCQPGLLFAEIFLNITLHVSRISWVATEWMSVVTNIAFDTSRNASNTSKKIATEIIIKNKIGRRRKIFYNVFYVLVGVHKTLR